MIRRAIHHIGAAARRRTAVSGSVLGAILCAVMLGLSIGAATPAYAQNVRSGQQVEAADGLQASTFARRLGDVSALAMGADGTVYSADRRDGRIFMIQDRRMDGRADVTRALPQRFDRPTGLAIVGERLFVADAGGVWDAGLDGGTPTLIAPFMRSGAADEPHPLFAQPDGSLRLGLSMPDGTAKLLSVSATGAATQIETGLGILNGFVPGVADQPPWVLTQRGDRTGFGPNLGAQNDAQMNVRAAWIIPTRGVVLLSTDRGLWEAKARIDGFDPKSLRYLARGFAAGPILVDGRGVFVADPARGTLLRLHAATQKAKSGPSGAVSRNDPPPTPALIRGSGIGSASTMGPASTMGQASQMGAASLMNAQDDPGAAADDGRGETAGEDPSPPQDQPTE